MSLTPQLDARIQEAHDIGDTGECLRLVRVWDRAHLKIYKQLALNQKLARVGGENRFNRLWNKKSPKERRRLLAALATAGAQP